MNRIIRIEPIEIPGKGTGEILEITLNKYQLFDSELKGDCQVLSRSNKVLLDEKFIVPSDVLNSWGIYDSYIVEFVADFMSVTIRSIDTLEKIVKPDKKENIYEKLRIDREARLNATTTTTTTMSPILHTTAPTTTTTTWETTTTTVAETTTTTTL